jgi:hypothetical protein
MKKQSLVKDVRIVIAPRAFVFVGEFSQDGVNCYVRNGCIVRHWGTTRGLGQIAKDGPTPKTILDPVPETRFHELTIMTIACDSDKWKGVLGHG